MSSSFTPGAPGTRRLPVILLTGFLGSGKTTLLLRWLAESPATGLRVGIVMNEFGADSVDGQLVRRPGLPIRQVDGGCVCCAPESDLDRACRELVRSGECDYLVLETSGLADPDSVIDVLTDPGLRQGIKQFSDWPTIPQLFVKGGFIGGCDIVREMQTSGELKTLFTDKGVATKAA